jgi:2-methylcitrate dehydratase PrpD
MIETKGYPLARLIPALVAGYEAGGVIEKALSGKTTPAGFRSSAIYGTIAASAAAAKLMELTAEQTAAALANAVSFAGGVLQSFADGTDEWRYQVGVVARNGLVAAELARAGSVSAPHAFEGKSGFARAFARTDLDGGLAASLGDDWAILRVAFKPYPVCAFNQTPVTGVLALRQELRAAPAKVRVRMNPYETGYAGMDAVGPFNSISGTLMSIPFCIATTLIHGAPTTRHMTTYNDPAVNDLINRVELISDASVPTLSAIIEAEMADGAVQVREQRMTAADYAYDMATLSAMLRRIGGEEGVPMSAFDRLERFVERLPQGSIDDAISVFTLAPSQARAA